jgi:pyruvate formate lyase activating enzyme
MITRRAFLKGSAAVLAAAAVVPPFDSFSAATPVEARYYEKTGAGRIRCLLCPRGCGIGNGERGHCGVRENRSGVLYTLVYAQPCALHIDPIEKKPFFHFLPGTEAVSLATAGCNLNCKFCQNWEISQSRPEDIESRFTPPARIVDQAVSLHAPSVAFTYGEPVVFIEYAQDIAKIARERKIKSVVVSNGYLRPEPLADLCGLVDAIKIDLKAFEEPYYEDICNATLQPVLDSIVAIHARGVWLELVYLVVPTLNDQTASIRNMARWIMANVGPDVPLHFSRFYPQYRLENLPPTPVPTLDAAYETCRAEGLRYVYVGNVPGHRAESTYCPNCSRKIITRSGYRVESIDMRNGSCRFCGHRIPGVWQEA